MLSSRRLFTDCDNIRYEVLETKSNGLCGFYCLGYALNGAEQGYKCVIEDLLSAFDLNPELYVQHTEVSKEMSLSRYKDVMNHEISVNIDKQSVERLLWLDTAHLIASCLMFHVTIFVYNAVRTKWIVFNDKGEHGYICLHFDGSHYELLQGADAAMGIRPHVPKNAAAEILPVDYSKWNEG